MTHLICFQNTDAWHPHSRLARAALLALNRLAIWQATFSGPGRNGTAVSVLAPESLKARLGQRYPAVTSYVDEFAHNPWENLIQDATRIQKEISLTLASEWSSHAEQRAWKGTEPWLVHKITYRVLGQRTIARRMSLQAPFRPLQFLFDAADSRFEKRERDHIWRRMLDRSVSRPNTGKHEPIDALLFSGSLYSPRVIVPLAHQMQRVKLRTHILATASTRAWPFDTGLLTEGLVWNYFLSHVAREELIEWFEKARHRGRGIANSLAKTRWTWPVEPYWESQIRRELNNALMWDWPLACVYEASFTRYLENCPPRVIVQTKNLRVIEGVVTECAISRKVPIIFLDSSILAGDVDHIRFPEPQHVVLAGPQAESAFRRIGAASHQIHPFGDLRMDRLSKRPLIPERQANFISDRIPVLAIGETIGEATAEAELESYYRSLVAIQKRFPELDILLKLHPKLTESEYLQQQKRWGLQTLRWVRDANTYDLIHQSHVVVTHMSQVSVEALFLGKPVFISLEGTPAVKRMALEKINMSLSARYATITDTYDQLQNAFDQFLIDPGFVETCRQKASLFRKDYFFNSDFAATDRVVDLIAQLTKHNTLVAV